MFELALLPRISIKSEPPPLPLYLRYQDLGGSSGI